MSKTIIRVATKDNYCYVEDVIESEGFTKTDPQLIKKRYDELHAEFNGYNDCNFLDDLLVIVKNNLRIEGEENLEQYEGFSDKQKLVLKEIKNLIVRFVRPYKPEKTYKQENVGYAEHYDQLKEEK